MSLEITEDDAEKWTTDVKMSPTGSIGDIKNDCTPGSASTNVGGTKKFVSRQVRKRDTDDEEEEEEERGVLTKGGGAMDSTVGGAATEGGGATDSSSSSDDFDVNEMVEDDTDRERQGDSSEEEDIGVEGQSKYEAGYN